MSAARQMDLFGAPAKSAPVAEPPLVEYDFGGAYTIDSSEKCIACGKLTLVRVGHPDGDRSADPRGVCGMQARVVLDPSDYGFAIGERGAACWDCKEEHGREGERRVIDRAVRVLGWRSESLAMAGATAAPAPTDAALPRTRLGDDVLRVLSSCAIDGHSVRLPGEKLDRKLYVRVNEALEALGGKWNRKAKAHLFDDDPGAALDAAISTGSVVRPADLGWYPTPPDLAAEIVRRADVRRGQLVLEPSAGEGAIARAARDAGATVTCIEIDPGRVEKLRRDGFNVIEGDFIACAPSIRFDRVVMNPPFGKRADVVHVTLAHRLLQSTGRLVAIMSAGVQFRQDAAATDFRTLVERCRGTIERLPEGSFRESGTSVNTCVVTMEAA